MACFSDGCPGCNYRHRYHGVLAPNAPLRKQVTERAGLPVSGDAMVSEVISKATAGEGGEEATGNLIASVWAMLLARIYEINPLVCMRCGGEMRIIAFLTESEPVGRILRHIGEPDIAPVITPARGPPDFCLELDQSQAWFDDVTEPVPEFEFDQSVSW
ncbi:MAG: hypothetical protein ABW185_01325 [Sedimenticola sp.]